MSNSIARSLLVLLFIIWGACTHHVYGQDFPMLHYGMEDGLPSNKIYEIYRDSKGFLWIATDKGIARYNGIKFEIFTTFDGLADNEIFFFQEDRSGRIWLATYNGELCYYQNGTFHNASNTPFLKIPFKTYHINSIIVEPDNSITVSFANQPYFFNIQNDQCYIFNLNNNFNIAYINENNVKTSVIFKHFYSDIICIVKNGNAGYKIIGRCKSYDVDNNTEIHNMNIYPYGYFLYHQFNQNQRFLIDRSNIYSLNKDTIKKFPDNRYEHLLNNSGFHRVYFYDKYSFIATDTGLYINDTMLLFKKQNISSFNQDTNKNFWVGTLTDGIYFLDKNNFNSYLLKNIYKRKIKYSTFKNGQIFYVTEGNNLFTLTNGISKCVFDFEKKYGQVNSNFPNEPGYFIDSNGKYYCFYNHLNCIVDNSSGKQRITEYKVSIFTDNIKSIFSNKGCLYLQNRWQIVKFNYAACKVGDTIDNPYKDINSLTPNSRIFCSAQDGDGTIWYSSRDSVYQIINDKSSVQEQFSNISLKCFSILEDYIIGYSHANTLYIIKTTGKNITIDSVKNQNCIWDKIYKIDKTHALITTNNNYRVISVHPGTKQPMFSILTIENAIIPLNVESICSDTKNVFFFKNGSVTAIDINTLLLSTQPPVLSFTFLKTNHSIIPAGNEKTIPFENAKNLMLSFSVLSFESKNIKYEYSISKSDKDNWIAIKGEDINLVNPSFGDYVIKVRAKTISSGFSAPVKFILHVARPFWATWWFISLVVIAAGSIIALYIRHNVSSMIAKKEEKHDNKIKFLRSEYKALNALMNPHFIFNTLNNVQSLFNGDNKLAANEYLRIFADLIRQNMHNVSKELIPLQKEVDLITNYLLLEKLRFEDKLNYNVSIDHNLDLFDVMIPPLLIQPLVENSIKHGILPLKRDDGFIRINIFEENNILHIEVMDNGVGINSASDNGSLHESFGLDNIRKRIEQLSIIQDKNILFEMKEVKESDVLWTVVSITMQL